MRHTLLIAFLALSACEVEEPCLDYVDYMCDCHDGEEGFDCTELTAIYADAGQDVQDQCAVDLSDQQATDETDGHECTTTP